MSTPDPDHRGLRGRLRAGDPDAFAEVYQAHVDAVFTLAYRLTGNWTTAEDVTSESFLVAWRVRGTIEIDDRPLLNWLLAISARQALNASRSVRRRIAFLSRGSASGRVEDFAEQAAGRIDDQRTLERTRAAVRALSRHEAEVLALCVWSELTYAEAAEVLGVPVTTVRSRLARARSRLRDLASVPSSRPSPRSGATTIALGRDS